jgi:hypothetical protein
LWWLNARELPVLNWVLSLTTEMAKGLEFKPGTDTNEAIPLLSQWSAEVQQNNVICPDIKLSRQSRAGNLIISAFL